MIVTILPHIPGKVDNKNTLVYFAMNVFYVHFTRTTCCHFDHRKIRSYYQEKSILRIHQSRLGMVEGSRIHPKSKRISQKLKLCNRLELCFLSNIHLSKIVHCATNFFSLIMISLVEKNGHHPKSQIIDLLLFPNYFKSTITGIFHAQ